MPIYQPHLEVAINPRRHVYFLILCAKISSVELQPTLRLFFIFFKKLLAACLGPYIRCLGCTYVLFPSVLKCKASCECFIVSRFIECSMNLDIQFVQIQRIFNESGEISECLTFQDGGCSLLPTYSCFCGACICASIGCNLRRLITMRLFAWICKYCPHVVKYL